MAHRTFEFQMPASESVVFDAFHYPHWRSQWDSLVSHSQVTDGAPCPYVGATTKNTGAGILSVLSMQTQFVSFDRPRVAAAAMLGQSFPFKRWAASMRHREAGSDQSVLIYTYTFDVFPVPLRWAIEPIVVGIFNAQTNRRFSRLRKFLTKHAKEVTQWQHQNAVNPDMTRTPQ